MTSVYARNVIPSLVPETRWVCPNCTLTAVTQQAEPHTRFHACTGMKGIAAPMVPVGVTCKVEAHEREDYVGDDDVQTDGDGRPIMSVVTTRDDGTDCVVFPPTVRAEGVNRAMD